MYYKSPLLKHVSYLLVLIVLACMTTAETTAQNCASYVFPYTMQTNQPSELVEAIECANSNTTDDVITLFDNISLTEVNNSSANGSNGLPVIQDAGTLTIDGSFRFINRDQAAPEMRIFEVAPNATLILDRITIKGGIATGSTFMQTQGGGILNFGTLILNRAQLDINHANNGGAISNHNVLIATRATFRRNVSSILAQKE